MKKLLSLILLVGGITLSANAQGLVKTNRVQPLSVDNALFQQFAVPQRAITKNAPRRASSEVYNVPASWAFDSQASFDEFTVIDANNDGGGTSRVNYSGQWAWYSVATGARYRYSANRDNGGDDWLITPAIHLEAGNVYVFSFETRGNGTGYTEALEVKFGTAPTVEGMTTTLLEKFEFSTGTMTADFFTKEAEVTVTETGNYYFGIHEVSDAYEGQVFVRNVSVKVGPDPNAPGEVTNLEIVPEATGAAKATVKFTAPAVNLAGGDLTEISGVKIIRGARTAIQPASDDELLADIRRVNIGQDFSFEDSYIDEVPRSYTYTIIPYSDTYGEGKAAQITEFIGLDQPMLQLDSPVLSKTESGLKLKWDAPEPYHHGKVYFPEQLKYTVVNNNNVEVASFVGQTEWNVDIDTEDGDQQLIYFAVDAENESGIGQSTWSNILTIGKPYEAPFVESFDGNNISYPFAELYRSGSGVNYGYAGIGFSSSSEDGSCLFMQTYYGDTLSFSTGKISLAGTTAPKLVYKLRYNSNSGGAYVFVKKADGTFDVIEATDLNTNTDFATWHTKKVDLSAYKDESSIQVVFAFADIYGYGYAQLFVDDIFVGDLAPKDLAVELKAPAKVTAGNKANVTVVVKNKGDETVDSYKLKLTAGDEELANLTIGKPLASLTNAEQTYEFTAPLLSTEESLEIKAEVTLADDGNTDDNVATAEVALEARTVPTVTDVAAQVEDDAVTLSWGEPSNEVQAETVTEDFETYAIGASATGEIGEWGIYKASGSYGYYVRPNGYNSVTADGQFLFSQWGSSTSNDWLISPELSGNAQIIKFDVLPEGYDEGRERYQVLYSTTTNDATDESVWTMVEEFREYGESWTTKTASLPAGAKYFVIRHATSYDDAGYFGLDNIVYEVGGQSAGEVEKYRIYRDGELLAETTATEFTDNELEFGENTYSYQITAVYTDGTESSPVTVSATATAIQSIIANGQPFDVYAIDGRLVRQQTKSLNGLRGIYVIGGKKVIVK
ncbi:MAG: choice-of-anchor J domain-containing protein [Prevotella sp.]|nr:choice-of-anchor J domain-containing protein [Prevotella sp.]